MSSRVRVFVGPEVAASLGEMLGDALEDEDGLDNTVGSALGDKVGTVLGAALCVSLGDVDGLEEDVTVRPALGTELAMGVGAAEGAAEGAAVGVGVEASAPSKLISSR
jgi:hypothetical protein